MTSVAQQIKESKWIAKWFLSATEERYERLCFIALMSWALAAPLTPVFVDHYFTYMISSTITAVLVAYMLCAKLLQRVAGVTRNNRSLRQLFFAQPWHFFLAGMAVWCVLSFVFAAEDKMRALKGGKNLCEGLTAYCFYAMLYVTAVWLKREKRREIVQLTILFGSIVPAAVFWLIEFGFTSFQYGWFGDWLFLMTHHRASIYQNSNYYGYYLTVILVMAAAYYCSSQKKGLRYAVVMVFCMNAVTLVVNNTLGAHLAVALSLVLIPVLFSIRKQFKLQYLVPLILFLGISVWVNFGLTWKDSEIISGNVANNYATLKTDVAHIVTGSEKAPSAGSGRWRLWKAAWELMLDKPLFGCGPEQMAYYMKDAVGKEYSWPHNEYLQHAAMLGIPAGLMYLAALLSLAFTQIRRVKLLSATTLIAGCVAFGYAVSAFFGGTTFVTTPYLFLALGMTSLKE